MDWEDYVRQIEESRDEARAEMRRLRSIVLENGLCPEDDSGQHDWRQPDPDDEPLCAACEQSPDEVWHAPLRKDSRAPCPADGDTDPAQHAPNCFVRVGLT